MTSRLLWTLLPHVVALETWTVLAGVPGLLQLGPSLLLVALVALVGVIVLVGARIRRIPSAVRRTVGSGPRRRPAGRARTASVAVLLGSGNGARGPDAGHVTAVHAVG
jgi:hypothetical protein